MFFVDLLSQTCDDALALVSILQAKPGFFGSQRIFSQARPSFSAVFEAPGSYRFSESEVAGDYCRPASEVRTLAPAFSQHVHGG